MLVPVMLQEEEVQHVSIVQPLSEETVPIMQI